jgi:hypothetical protein
MQFGFNKTTENIFATMHKYCIIFIFLIHACKNSQIIINENFIL